MLAIFILMMVLTFGAQMYLRSTFGTWSKRPNASGMTGRDVADAILRKHGLSADVAIEPVKGQLTDHYDPTKKVVRLSEPNYGRASVAAMAVAAHEVGHAIQHADGYKPLMWRTRLVKSLARLQRLGVILIALMPVAILALRLPRAGVILLIVGLATLASGIVVHLMTLPTELDASFRRALPLLNKGGYLKPGDQPHARRILTAAAFTYVAASLMGLVNFWWWLRVLRP